MSLPIGMHHRAFSYEDVLEDSTLMTLPSSDMCNKVLWKKLVIPDQKYHQLSKVEEGDNSLHKPLSFQCDQMNKAPVVKAKARQVIMNSLITKGTQESIQCFEQGAELTDAGYTPHKGFITEEAKYHCMVEAVHKLKLQNGEMTKEDRQPSPLQVVYPSSPKQKPRGWFTHGSSASLPGLDVSSMDSGNGDRDKPSSEKWSLFGPRTLQKSNKGFSVQWYKGTQKPSPMELFRVQATRIAEDPEALKTPKMDFPVMEGKKQPSQTHNLKPKDINVLIPIGF
ncbi:LOW QUALITY PROTEIN: putative monooxygenase p33MONOX [Dromiciops gliroides]|uniref:LOW QUALITY PROTEIN: putative monooxygenase p33MONOX n=1 Tax=Dromiciops gliroides TaxID=33562 RepID=UPI001CC4C9EE|nr:LOW QUALITY PROTEIN: putative monooxygenase p33MONOX [Dromiciops gliroides]